MSAVASIKAEIREGKGTGSARALRREGKVPGIIYGGKKGETKISTPLKELNLEYLRGDFTSRVYEIDLGKEKVKVIPRDIQLHPVTDTPEHVDFMRISGETNVRVKVRVHFNNHEKSPGLKRGGILNVVRHEVELLCHADSIPHTIEADLADLQIGQSIHISHIKLPKGAEPTIRDRDFTIATIVGRTAKDDVVDEAPAAAAATAAAPAAAGGDKGKAPAAADKGKAPAADKGKK